MTLLNTSETTSSHRTQRSARRIEASFIVYKLLSFSVLRKKPFKKHRQELQHFFDWNHAENSDKFSQRNQLLAQAAQR